MSEKLCNLRLNNIVHNNNEDGYIFTFEAGELSDATDANPIIIYGDFSDIKAVLTMGVYVTYSLPAQNRYYTNITEITVTSAGTSLDLLTGQSATSHYYGYRHITIYPDRLEIGSGYFNNHQDDIGGYGGLQILALSKTTPYQ